MIEPSGPQIIIDLKKAMTGKSLTWQAALTLWGTLSGAQQDDSRRTWHVISVGYK